MQKEKYPLPAFLEGVCLSGKYRKWLHRASSRHYRRDKRRGNITITQKKYKEAIHSAVIRSNGLDAYTGQPLCWKLIGKYDNNKAKKKGRKYKKRMGNMPTIDHVGNGMGTANFKICSWRVNDCKNDLNLCEFLKVCEAVIEFNKK